jgi:hypothetical protein
MKSILHLWLFCLVRQNGHIASSAHAGRQQQRAQLNWSKLELNWATAPLTPEARLLQQQTTDWPDWIWHQAVYRVGRQHNPTEENMKRILISAALALALAGTSAFAAQNKNTKKPAAKSSNTATMTKNTGGGKTKGKSKRHHRKGHRKSTGKAKNKNM